MKNGQINRTIEHYLEEKESLIDFFNNRHNLNEDVIVTKAKELEIIIYKLEVLYIAKHN